MSYYIQLHRQFLSYDSYNNSHEIDWESSFNGNSSASISWSELLKNDKVVILAEAGSGKTTELKNRAKLLHDASQAAFFCRIEDLLESDFDPKDAWEIGSYERFITWKESTEKGAIAYFFLDSVEEAKLHKRNAFRIALKRFVKTIGEGNIHHANVYMTSRFSEWQGRNDLDLFCDVFEIRNSNDSHQTILFRLEPLNDDQIKQFALEQQVACPEKFLNAIERADAKLFANRPQDLLDLITYWKDNNQSLPTQYQKIIEYNIQQKLCEKNRGRKSGAVLSADEALNAARQLAATVTLTHKNKIRLPSHFNNLETIENSFDPKVAIPYLSDNKIELLLSRPLFDEAIYGTARFHHRSIREFLTAKWFYQLLQGNYTRRYIENLLFSTIYNQDVAIPSMQPISAWLACWDEKIRDRLVQLAPEALITYGDPSNFPIDFRIQLLDKLIEKYRNQQWTDLHFDPKVIKRLSSPEMSEVINLHLKQFAEHRDLSELLLRMVDYGEVKDSIDVAIEISLNKQLSERTRVKALSTVLSTGLEAQKQALIKGLLSQKSIGCYILGCECRSLFPKYISVDNLMEIILAFPKKDMRPILMYHLGYISENPVIDEQIILNILLGIKKIIHNDLHGRMHNYVDTPQPKPYSWVIESAVYFANQLFKNRSALRFDSIVLHTYWAYLELRDVNASQDQDSVALMREDREFCYQLFWYMATMMQKVRHPYWHYNGIIIKIKKLWLPALSDWERLISELIDRPKGNERLIALTALYDLYINDDPSTQRLQQLKQAVAHDDELISQLNSWINPPPPTAEALERELKNRQFEEKRQQYEEEQAAIHADWKQHIQAKANQLLVLGDTDKGIIWQEGRYLYDWLRPRKENIDKWSISEWELLIDEFGQQVAENFREGCKAYWRLYNPLFQKNYRINDEIEFGLIIGLSGLAMEARQPNWIEKLTEKEVKQAAYYAMYEINGFPDWFIKLRIQFPSIVNKVILDGAKYELSPEFSGSGSSILEYLYYYSEYDSSNLGESLLIILESASDYAKYECMEYALKIILKYERSIQVQARLSLLARKCFYLSKEQREHLLWIYVLLNVDANFGIKVCKAWLGMLSTQEARIEIANKIFAQLEEEFVKNSSRSVVDSDFKQVDKLQALTELAYQFIRYEDDIHRKSGSYYPNVRDVAQRVRGNLLSEFAEISGLKTYKTLLRWIDNPNYQSYKDYLLILAKNRIQADSELEPWKEEGVAEFSQEAEKQPTNEFELYQLAINRLLDLKDELEQADDSIANIVKRIDKETELRNFLSNQLRKVSKGKYKIAQEEEMADATRTDIRFLLPDISPTPVELKIADKWSFNDLHERLENQLIKQYMKVSKFGVFLLVYRGGKTWKNNKNTSISFGELLQVLERYAHELVEKYSSISDIKIIGIDLTIR